MGKIYIKKKKLYKVILKKLFSHVKLGEGKNYAEGLSDRREFVPSPKITYPF